MFHCRQYALMMLSCVLLGACDKKPQSETTTQSAPTEAHDHAEFPKPTAPALLTGYEVFAKVCSHCHIESEYAPVINNPKEWRQRLDKRGRETLLKHAIEGYGDMMPKGGRRGKDLTDEQVAQGLDYILSLLPEEE